MSQPPKTTPSAHAAPVLARQPGAGAVEIVALTALAILLVSVMTVRQFPDPDMYHEMALYRYALEHGGGLPREDPFAYTPTRVPFVHHEWGWGAVLYHVTVTLGGPGILGLRYLMAAGIAVVAVTCARRRGAGWPALCTLTPLAILLGHIGLTTLRAQVFTLLATAALLLWLDVDRRGRHWWIAPWLALYLIWLNLHAGFVVGVALFAAHWIEQVFRTRTPQWHLIFTGMAMAGLVLVNPYGWDYVPFLWQSVGMDRPMIPEWWPLWRLKGSDALPFYIFIFSAIILLYVMWRGGGLKKLPGLLIVLLCAYASLRHVRHASLFAVAWVCYGPALVQGTPLGTVLTDLWNQHRRMVGGAFITIAAVCLLAMPNKPWKLQFPVTLADEAHAGVLYPVGAMTYLRENDFRGNVMTSYAIGAYITWKLFPQVKVGQDARYECAFQPGVIEELTRFYYGHADWKATLAKYPTDVLLVPRYFPLARLMAEQTQWPRVYHDDAVDLYTRPGLDLELHLPIVDRSGEPLSGEYP